jgi:trans-2,3-dihydro-3-hydroxyanthranilate isomerase
VVAWDEDTYMASTRMFAGDIGKDEDAATGSAALALGVYLGANRLIEGPRARIAVTQGEEMGRHSRLDVTCELADGLVRSVTVGGGAVHVTEGLIAVPD